MPPSRPWAAPVSELCAAINKSDRYNTTGPSPGRGSPGPGGRRRAKPPDHQLCPSPAPRVNLPWPCAADLEQEYPARPQAAHASLANAPSWPPGPNSKESSLHSISPMFGSAVQERAMASVTHGRVRSSRLRVVGILSAQGQHRRARAGRTGVPRLAWRWFYIMDQANLASFLHRLVKSSICRANSFYVLLYVSSSFLLFWFLQYILFLPHRCVRRECKAHFWGSLRW